MSKRINDTSTPAERKKFDESFEPEQLDGPSDTVSFSSFYRVHFIEFISFMVSGEYIFFKRKRILHFSEEKIHMIMSGNFVVLNFSDDSNSSILFSSVVFGILEVVIKGNKEEGEEGIKNEEMH